MYGTVRKVWYYTNRTVMYRTMYVQYTYVYGAGTRKIPYIRLLVRQTMYRAKIGLVLGTSARIPCIRLLLTQTIV